MWALVWRGLLTNDTLHALRAFVRRRSARAAHRACAASSARAASCRCPPRALDARDVAGWPSAARSPTEWATAMAQQLLARHGIVTRDVTAIEQLPGGFSGVYPVLRRLEETGRIRRGYFVAGLGAAQFAQPGAIDLLRDARDERDETVAVARLGDRSRPIRTAC